MYICHECGVEKGDRKPEGAHTGRITECSECGERKLTSPSRHYFTEEVTN